MSSSKILFLSHTPDNGVFKVGSHHLARELSKASMKVAHVSTPRSWVHRALGKGSTQPAANRNGVLDEFGTMHLVPSATLPVQLAEAGQSLEKAIKRIGFDDADYILIDQPLMSGYVRSAVPRGKVVYRPTDTYDQRPASIRQNFLVNSCVGLVATSGAVLNELKIPENLPRLILENGVELGRFGGDVSSHRSGFVYVGAVDYRFDWDSVISIANANPNEEVRIIGPISRERRNLPANIRLLGSISYDQVPSYLLEARVGLIPLNSADVNQGRSPMKYYEYLASGLSVVATSTASLRERNTSQTLLFRDAGEAARVSRISLTLDAPNTRGIEDAKGQDWPVKAGLLLEFLRSL